MSDELDLPAALDALDRIKDATVFQETRRVPLPAGTFIVTVHPDLQGHEATRLRACSMCAGAMTDSDSTDCGGNCWACQRGVETEPA